MSVICRRACAAMCPSGVCLAHFFAASGTCGVFPVCSSAAGAVLGPGGALPALVHGASTSPTREQAMAHSFHSRGHGQLGLNTVPAHAVPTAQPPTASTTSQAGTARQATTPTGSPTLPTSGNAVLKSEKTTAPELNSP